jgi:hypothetical protein
MLLMFVASVGCLVWKWWTYRPPLIWYVAFHTLTDKQPQYRVIGIPSNEGTVIIEECPPYGKLNQGDLVTYYYPKESPRKHRYISTGNVADNIGFSEDFERIINFLAIKNNQGPIAIPDKDSAPLREFVVAARMAAEKNASISNIDTSK